MSSLYMETPHLIVNGFGGNKTLRMADGVS